MIFENLRHIAAILCDQLTVYKNLIFFKKSTVVFFNNPMENFVPDENNSI